MGGDMVRFVFDITVGKGKVITKNHSIRKEKEIVKKRWKSNSNFQLTQVF